MFMKDNKANELLSMKKELEILKTNSERLSSKLKRIKARKGKETSTRPTEEDESAVQTSSALLKILQLVMDENKKTRDAVNKLSDQFARLEVGVQEADPEEDLPQATHGAAAGSYPEHKEVPLSQLDTKIVQFIDRNGWTCADDIKKLMGYRGRNAASTRLNRLYKEEVLERKQLGHKVYYKYSAGNAVKQIHLVSPPESELH